MVVHWWHNRDQRGWQPKMLVNGVGAVATGITLVVVLVAKFASGAWVTAALVPLIILTMMAIKRHYARVEFETADETPLRLTGLEPPVVVLPIAQWNKVSEKAMRFGLLMSSDIRVVHVESDHAEGFTELETVWDRMVAEPMKAADFPVPSWSPFRLPTASWSRR